MPSGFCSGALLFFTLVAAGAHAAEPGRAEFESGVALYRTGNHQQALAAFLEARRQGLDIPNLHFNLGLSYYRQARYPEARGAFERLRQFPGYAGIADFHLGLVAARQGDRTRAAALWRGVASTAPETALRDRAQVAMGRLDTEPAATAATAYVLAAAGRDTNPALVDDGVQPAGENESSSLELFGAFDYPLAAPSAAVTILRGGAYARTYARDNGLDQHGVFAGVSREHAAGPRRRSFFVDAASSYLDGERFANTFSAGGQTSPARRGSGLTLRGQLGRIATAEPYGYLDGWRLRGDAELGGRAGPARLYAGYQFEFNEREDMVSGDEFFSHSPLRHRLALSLDHPVAARWWLQWSLRYRHSRYRDPNRFTDSGGTLREERRVEDLAQAGVQARRRISAVFSALLEYQYSRNTSAMDVFDYDRHLALIGVEWLPQGP